ncbi:hypothetical protein NSP_17290 [Nodularia spumigena CCY9414]|nr:hypothetical protein NSP_17290 [Nodularia spumigena CCY9414]
MDAITEAEERGLDFIVKSANTTTIPIIKTVDPRLLLMTGSIK